MRKWPKSNETRRTREATGRPIFRCGGYLRWRIGLASWQDGMDRPGAHGVNSLSGLRGYGGTINYQRTTTKSVSGAAGICGGDLDWSMDMADGAGNGRVRKPRIRTKNALQNLSQALVNVLGQKVSAQMADAFHVTSG